MRIDHIAFWTKNLEIEKEFFIKYFECTASRKYVNPLNHFSSYFMCFKEGSRIELMHRPDIYQNGVTDSFGMNHFAIDVGSREDVDFLTKKMQTDGIEIISYPRLTGDGYYESVIFDPEKNTIELMANMKSDI